MKYFKLYLALFVIVLMRGLLAIEEDSISCEEGTYEVKNSCYSCDELFAGCAECDLDESKPVCAHCIQGYYLLTTFVKSESSGEQYTSSCVKECPDLGSKYVPYEQTKSCIYCGEFCTKCSISEGCTESFGINKGYSFLTGYTPVDSTLYSVLPTRWASTFQTSNECNETCNSCQNDGDECLTCKTGVLEGTTCTTNCNPIQEGCALCDSDHLKCLECTSGRSYPPLCGECSISNCDRCSLLEVSECEVCNYLFYENNTNCMSCTITFGEESLYCTADEGPLVCEDGFVPIFDEEKYSCIERSCEESEYWEIEIVDHKVIRKMCASCEQDNCKSCSSSASDGCTECDDGYYLATTTGFFGECIEKSSTPENPYILYVSNLDYPNLNNEPQDGTEEHPFNDLMSAYQKAKEIGAQYYGAIIYIKLYKGSHFLLQNAEIYLPKLKDTQNLDYEIYIEPLRCSDYNLAGKCTDDEDKVIIYNKRASELHFDVPQILKVSYLIFDSVDCIYNYWDASASTCMTEYTQCCEMGSDDTLTSVNGVINCQLQKREQCQIPSLHSMFELKLTEHHGLQRPNELTLDNCEIKNVFYELGAVVEINVKGAIVKITDTTFSHFSTCGTIIRYYPSLAQEIQLYSQGQLNDSNMENFLLLIEQFYESLDIITDVGSTDEYQQSQCSTNQGTCHQLIIQNSQFSKLEFNKELLDTEISFKDDEGVKYVASAILLFSFPGDVTIENSSFLNNAGPFSQCNSYGEFGNILNSLSPSSFWEDEIGVIIFKLGSFEQCQIHSMISILEHSHAVTLDSNSFYDNAAGRGIIYITLDSPESNQREKLVKINNNQFERNSGFMFSNVIFIQIYNFDYLSYDYNKCGGVHLEGNNFTNNVGCFDLVSGAVRIHCSPPDSKYTGFIHPLYQEGYEYETFYESFQASESYEFEFDPDELEDYDTRIIKFKNNEFLENFSSSYSGVVDLSCLFAVKIEGDIFEKNGFAFNEVFKLYSPIYQLFSENITSSFDTDYPLLQNVINSPNSEENPFPVPYGTISNTYTLHIYIDSATFDENYLPEYPIQSTELLKYQGLILSSQGVNSEILFQDVSIINHSGLNNQYLVDSLGLVFPLTYDERSLQGSLAPLFTFNEEWFPKSFVLKGCTFEGNKLAGKRNGTTYTNYQFFFLDKSDQSYCSLYTNSVQIIDSTISHNTCLDCKGIMHTTGFGLNIERTTISDYNDGYDISDSKLLTLFYLDPSSKCSGNETEIVNLIDCTISNIIVYNSPFYLDNHREELYYTSYINGTTFTNVTGASVAHLAYLKSTMGVFRIYDTLITDIEAEDNPILYIKGHKEIHVEDVEFSNIQLNATIILVEDQDKGYITFFKKITYQCQSTFDLESITTALKNMDETYFATPIGLYRCSSITFVECSFSNCFLSKIGGVLFATEVMNLEDIGSTYSNNAALYGGALYLEGSYVYLTNSILSGNVANQGFAVYCTSASTFSSVNSSYISNIGLYSGNEYSMGTLYLGGLSIVNIDGGDFTGNTGYDGVAIEFIQSQMSPCSISNVNFEGNSGTSNLVTLLEAPYVTIQSCNFSDNSASLMSHNLFISFSTDISVQDCIFENTITIEDYSTASTTGGFIFISTDSVVDISNSQFINGVAGQGGAIYLSSEGTAHITDECIFSQNSADKGGAIYASDHMYPAFKHHTFFIRSLSVDGQTSFSQNKADEGADFYIGPTGGYHESDNIIDSIIITKTQGNSIMGKRANIVITNSEFSNNSPNTPVSSAIYCNECKIFQISGVTISNYQSEIGAGIYLKTDFSRDFSDEELQYPHTITSTTIKACSAYTGGGLCIDNSAVVELNSVTFDSNSANNLGTDEQTDETDSPGKGAGIAFFCGKQTCSLTLSTCTFQNNAAESSGGAIFYSDIEPTNYADQTYSSNIAEEYGDNIASFAQQLIMISEAQYNETKIDDTERRRGDTSLYSKTLSGFTSIYVTDHGSGSSIELIYMALIDKYSQLVGDDSASKISITLNSKDVEEDYTASLDGKVTYIASHGLFNVSGMELTATPLTTQTLTMETDAIDYTKPENKEFLEEYMTQNGLSEVDTIAITITVDVRLCVSGEAFNSLGQCTECDNSYLIDPPTDTTTCIACPDHALCLGGNKFGPESGYWRSSLESLNFFKCYNEECCLGISDPNYNPQGDCKTGYQGFLCTDCQVGYSREGFYKCDLCPASSLNVLRMIGLFIFLVAILIVIVYFTIENATERRSISSVYLRIFLNHLQLIILTTSFQLDWPSMIKYILNIPDPVANVAQHFLSLDCFIDTRVTNDDISQIFYKKVILVFFFPLMAFVGSVVFWLVFGIIRKKDKNSIITKILVTNLILLFIVHPGITEKMLDLWNCANIDGNLRLKQDLKVMCWEGSHWLYAFLIAFPGFLVWGLSFPGLIFYYLRKRRTDLKTPEMKTKFGFLYEGYKKQRYFWEVYIMLRKIVLIICALYLRSVGVVIQALVVFLLLIIFLFLNITQKPFLTKELNTFETYSLITSILTIYGGLFFISTDNPEGLQDLQSAKWLFFFIILIANILFFVYWGFRMVEQLRIYLLRKYPKIFFYICACKNIERDAKAKQKLKKMDEDDLVKQQLWDLLKTMKKQYLAEELYLDRNTLDELNAIFGLEPENTPQEEQKEESQEEETPDDKKRRQIESMLGKAQKKVIVQSRKGSLLKNSGDEIGNFFQQPKLSKFQIQKESPTHLNESSTYNLNP